MINVIFDTALLTSGSLQYGVRRNARYEVTAQIRRELCKTLLAQHLRGTEDRRRIDVVSLGHFA